MSKAKREISVRISEDLVDELDYWVQIFHDENLAINRSDFIAVLLIDGLERLEADLSEMSNLQMLTQAIAVSLKEYYMEHDLVLRGKRDDV